MANVEVKGLRKEFADTVAVDGVDLKGTEGEFLVLLGPSGCGKTTLLRMIAGLETPTSGEIHIAGELMNGLPPRDRKIAMVFQSYALYPHMTVFGNIAFPLKAEGLDAQQRREKVEWAARLLDIERHLERHPRHLSGGERQRVALARALVREPSVFLLDEPLSNLDAKLRAAARDDLLEFQHRVGITTVYVTHDQVEAMGMGDRIAVMNQGRIRQFGTPDEIYNHPADTFVARFIGSPPMNLLDGADYIIGFRPEDFLPEAISAEMGPTGSNFKFEVSRVENLGSDRFLYGTVPGLNADTKVISRLPSTISLPIEAGRAHRFAVTEPQLKRFDSETGLSLDGHPS